MALWMILYNVDDSLIGLTLPASRCVVPPQRVLGLWPIVSQSVVPMLRPGLLFTHREMGFRPSDDAHCSLLSRGLWVAVRFCLLAARDGLACILDVHTRR